MFDTPDLNSLRHELDAFAVPMFAAERRHRGDCFRLLCLNEAHERETGMRSADVSGRTLRDVLPEDEGAAVEDRYTQCAERRRLSRYREQLTINGKPTIWETTLQPVIMPDTRARVIGTAKRVHGDALTMAMEEAAVLAAQAQYHLTHLGTFLTSLADREDLPGDLRNHTSVVMGLHRCLDRTVEDLRRKTGPSPSHVTGLMQEIGALSQGPRGRTH